MNTYLNKILQHLFDNLGLMVKFFMIMHDAVKKQ